jgi:hypothetical protein
MADMLAPLELPVATLIASSMPKNAALPQHMSTAPVESTGPNNPLLDLDGLLPGQQQQLDLDLDGLLPGQQQQHPTGSTIIGIVGAMVPSCSYRRLFARCSSRSVPATIPV